MNNIPVKQNEQKQLERLAAQRELYSSAKRYQILQLVLNVVVPISGGILGLYFDKIIVYAACYGLIVTFLDPIVLEEIIKRKREKASQIQELFDCEVLQLKTSPLKTSNDDMVEEVLKYYKAHEKIPSDIEKIRDWYPKAIDILPIEIARLICQRTNCYWDSRVRMRYADGIKWFGIVIASVILLIATYLNPHFDVVVLFASALLPLLQYCIKQYKDQKEAAKRLTRLVNYAKEIWTNDLTKGSEVLNENSRRLQDEIYVHRSKSPLILNFVYNWFRDQDEDIMNSTADHLIQTLKDRKII